MIKRSLFFLLFAISSLFASDLYDSNELMQKISPIETFSGIGWELEADEQGATLYHNGSLHSTKKNYADGYETITPLGRERVILNKDGLIERKIIESDSRTEEYNYFYTDGILSSYNLSVDGEVERVVTYATSKEGRLLSFESGEMRYLSPEFFVYTLDEKAIRLDNGEVKIATGDIEDTEDGGYKKTLDGVLYTYSPEGRLISEESDGGSIYYSYAEDGSIAEKKTASESEVIEEFYSNGTLTKTLYSENGAVIRELYPLESGEFEEIRYLDGKTSYRILYDRDGKRVKEIVKL